MIRKPLLAALALACAASPAIAANHIAAHLSQGGGGSGETLLGLVVGCGLIVVATLAACHAMLRTTGPRGRDVACVIAALSIFLVVPAALAAEEVARVGDTAIVLPWGAWLAAVMPSIASAAITALTGLATVYLQRVAPIWLSALLQSRIETMIQTAIAYALNDVEGAAKGKVLTVPVGSAVIARALQRIVDSTPAWLIRVVPGGLPELGARIFRSLDLEPDSTAARVLEPALASLGPAAR